MGKTHRCKINEFISLDNGNYFVPTIKAAYELFHSELNIIQRTFVLYSEKGCKLGEQRAMQRS